jgi:carbon monoxide dehydrogenase subunit G
MTEEVEKMNIETKNTINRPLDQVWSHIADVENWAKWQEGVEQVEITSQGPIGVGSTYKMVSQIWGRKVETENEITEYDSKKAISFRSISGPFPINGHITLEPHDGATRINFSAEGEVAGFFKMAKPLVERQTRSIWETSLENLEGIFKPSQ